MPEMNGEEFRLALSNLKGGDETPFVFLSGSDEKSHPYLSRLGIDDFLSKPLDAEKLVNLTDRLLRRSEQLKNAHTGQFNSKLIEALKPSLPPQVGLWHMAVRHSVAEAGGGDFIFHNYADDGMNILLADVMGHGAAAKFFAYAYAGYLRSIFRMENDNQSPAQFLDHLSKSISGDELLENVIMTCVAIKLKKNGEANLATAGHPSPFLFRKGVLSRIELRGPLPGLSISLARQMLGLNLEQGDNLIFMTDGMTDIMNTIKEWPVFESDIANSLADYIWHQFRKQDAVQKRMKDDSTLIVIGRGGFK
jgi:sigma-B regulation protein RsbU (phosphoserine phosphatase)